MDGVLVMEKKERFRLKKRRVSAQPGFLPPEGAEMGSVSRIILAE